jgi:hypothetical protein
MGAGTHHVDACHKTATGLEFLGIFIDTRWFELHLPVDKLLHL